MPPAPQTTSVPAPRAPTCLTCRYPLTNLPENRCPECGRAFDPNDPLTFGPRAHRFAHILAAIVPPRWLNILYAVIAFPLFLLMCGPAGCPLSDAWSGVWMYVIGGTVIAWFAALAARSLGAATLALRKVRRPVLTGRQTWTWAGRWLFIPAFLLLCGIMQASGIVWRMRWSAARSSFAAMIDQPVRLRTLPWDQHNVETSQHPHASTPAVPFWVGTYHVYKVTQDTRGAVHFYIDFPDVYSQYYAQIVYSPNLEPMGLPISRHIGDGWWLSVNPT